MRAIPDRFRFIRGKSNGHSRKIWRERRQRDPFINSKSYDIAASVDHYSPIGATQRLERRLVLTTDREPYNPNPKNWYG